MFEFDPAKSRSNLDKHGIDFLEAQNLWLDERLLVVPARLVAGHEPRWLAIGLIGGKYWSAIFTLREANVRIISVRRARQEEVRLYDDEGF